MSPPINNCTLILHLKNDGKNRSKIGSSEKLNPYVSGKCIGCTTAAMKQKAVQIIPNPKIATQPSEVEGS